VDGLKLGADAWFEGTKYHDRNVARAVKLTEKWVAMAEGREEARAAALAKLTTEATAGWPPIAKSIKAQEGFTPDKLDAFKGKTIHMTAYNRLGSNFNPGDYDFACEVNGMPVAGKFSRPVAEAVDKATKQTGHDLPGADWDIYAVVEGPGQISRRTRSNGFGEGRRPGRRQVHGRGQSVGAVRRHPDHRAARGPGRGRLGRRRGIALSDGAAARRGGGS